MILHCNVSSNPASQIVWYKDGTKIKVKDSNFFRGADQCPIARNGYYFQLRKGVKRFSRLIICDTRLDKNNGTFTCKARNQLGNGISSATLNVWSKWQLLFFLLKCYPNNAIYLSLIESHVWRHQRLLAFLLSMIFSLSDPLLYSFPP